MALRTTVVGSWWKLDEHEDELAVSPEQVVQAGDRWFSADG
jgi:hypothetical protein